MFPELPLQVLAACLAARQTLAHELTALDEFEHRTPARTRSSTTCTSSAEVSNLEISGMCEQIDDGRRLLHVIGRTRKSPHVHYYRRRGSTGVWSPWESSTSR